MSDEEAGDPSRPGVYAGGDAHPYELLFIKTNRKLVEREIERPTRLHNNFNLM